MGNFDRKYELLRGHMDKEKLESMIDKSINQENIKTYNRCGIKNPREMRHICVLCKSATSIDGSMSVRGNRLICIHCQHKYFRNEYEAYCWVID